MAFRIPAPLAENCRTHADRQHWVESLPALIKRLEDRWAIRVSPHPFEGEDGSCAWVAPAELILQPGVAAVLKLGMPSHMEGDHEIRGLRFWNSHGAPVVRLLMADKACHAMLLEHCEPGQTLRSSLPEPEQDVVVANLLRQLRRPVPNAEEASSFRPLAVMIEAWIGETMDHQSQWVDAGLVREGIALYHELTQTQPSPMLLTTDLHAGNVLRANREPWLVIDPKPFLGDPSYDGTQHLLNCEARLLRNPRDLLHRFADLAGLCPDRLRRWTLARLATTIPSGPETLALARALENN